MLIDVMDRDEAFAIAIRGAVARVGSIENSAAYHWKSGC